MPLPFRQRSGPYTHLQLRAVRLQALQQVAVLGADVQVHAAWGRGCKSEMPVYLDSMWWAMGVTAVGE